MNKTATQIIWSEITENSKHGDLVCRCKPPNVRYSGKKVTDEISRTDGCHVSRKGGEMLLNEYRDGNARGYSCSILGTQFIFREVFSFENGKHFLRLYLKTLFLDNIVNSYRLIYIRYFTCQE